MYERIRNLRVDSDVTQDRMAELLEISQATYSRYEAGKLDMAPDVLIKLALHYETSIDYLLGLTDTMTPYPRSR